MARALTRRFSNSSFATRLLHESFILRATFLPYFHCARLSLNFLSFIASVSFSLYFSLC